MLGERVSRARMGVVGCAGWGEESSLEGAAILLCRAVAVGGGGLGVDGELRGLLG